MFYSYCTVCPKMIPEYQQFLNYEKLKGEISHMCITYPTNFVHNNLKNNSNFSQ